MQWLLTSKTKDIPMGAVDWLMLSANGVGLAIVLAATLQAQSPGDGATKNGVQIASLDP